MELVANLWPIVDAAAPPIMRFAACAYVMDASERVISSTLKSLATWDFVLAQQFAIPKRFTFTCEHGELPGIVTVADFNAMQPAIIEEALRTLEANLPVLQGAGVTAAGVPFQRRIAVSFPPDPYLLVTFLIENTAGNLHIYSPA
ncbi:MAG TPA: hypothetical protein VF614_07865 [Chthoniobacteraceae bacterium]|jgi:hypothetical protein